jgi:hypothetical protein
VFGFTRQATSLEPLDDGRVKVACSVTDYVSGNVTSDQKIASPFYSRAKGGGTTKMSEDRFLDVVLEGVKSRLKRNVFLDSVPAIIKASFRDECEKKMAKLIPAEIIDQRIVPAFKEHGIGLEHLEQLVGRPKSMGWREHERLELRKLLTALNDGETTAKELLADLQDPEAPKESETTEAPQGGITTDDLTKDAQQKAAAQGQGARKKEEAPAKEEPAPTTKSNDLEGEWAAAREEFASGIAKATGIQMCRKLANQAREKLPEDEHEWIDQQEEARIAVIRMKRDGPKTRQGNLLDA